MKLTISVLIMLSACIITAQQSKQKVIKNIHTWYENNTEKYTLSIKENEANAIITKHHPERSNEKNDLIKISYEGMKIELKFSKPIEEITTHKDSLQKYFSYVSLTNIYTKIPSKGWKVHPRTPQSSLRGKSLKFVSGGDSISLNLNWSIYSVIGYKDNTKCDKERSIADGVVSESCYIAVDKAIPLELTIIGIALE